MNKKNVRGWNRQTSGRRQVAKISGQEGLLKCWEKMYVAYTYGRHTFFYKLVCIIRPQSLLLLKI